MMLQIKKIAKAGLVFITASSLLIGTSAPAFAGGHHRDGHHYKHKKHYGGHHYRGYKKYRRYKHHRNHYRYGYYGRGYYGGYYGYYGHKRKYRHRSHNTGAAILFGAAAGALIYHGISSANKHNDRGYRNVSNRDYVNPDHYNGNNNNQWTNARNVQPRASQVSHSQQRSQDCMQEREYQTTITVGGNTVPAYGTACLQPDGSWKFGDPIPEPSYQ